MSLTLDSWIDANTSSPLFGDADIGALDRWIDASTAFPAWTEPVGGTPSTIELPVIQIAI